MAKKECCPSKEVIEQLEQTARIFSTDLSNWSHTHYKKNSK